MFKHPNNIFFVFTLTAHLHTPAILKFTDECSTVCRKGFVVFGNHKLHRTTDSNLISKSRIISATVANLDGTPVRIQNTPDAVTIHYSDQVSC